MKNQLFRQVILFTFCLLTSVFFLQAQAPLRFSYQSIIRNPGGQALPSQPVAMRLSILQGSDNGGAVYVETHSGNTNGSGLLTLEIGGGTIVSGTMAAIDWANGPFFIKTETDPEGGTNYSITGTSPLLSVPFSLHSNTSGSAANGVPSGGTHGQVLTLCNGVLTWTTGGNCPPSLPTLSTTTISAITSTAANSGGNITWNGGANITSRGVCWSTSPNPTVALTTKTTNGTGSGSFSSTLSGLNSNSQYYIRAYATNSVGTAYGNQVIFTTQPDSLDIETSLIPAGTFTMGSPITEPDRNTNEVLHQVTLSAFKMSKYEISNAQYAAFLNAYGIGQDGIYEDGAYPTQTLIYDWGASNGLSWTGSLWQPESGKENFPVVCVTWYGAAEFASYAGGRLPTEAEWEYACRGGTSTPFSTGNCLDNTLANYAWLYPLTGCTNSNTNYPNQTQAVNSYNPNVFGLYNMHGNVLEWCADWYGAYPNVAQTNPTGPAIGEGRVLRGGCLDSYAEYCRSAYRYAYNPSGSGGFVFGFRLAFAP